MNKDEILVTVFCEAFNHEKYIRKALEGFVMQKTNFNFEVIVHDDASTDSTVSIIKEFEKYPCIRPFYEVENQHSKGVDFYKSLYSEMRGKFVAYCEGDDYWTDENKLQILCDYMQNHPECSMCCHSYYNIEANTEKIIKEINTLEEEGDISIDKAILFVNPPQLASQMFRKDIRIDMPDLFRNRGVGDYPMLLYAATQGSLHFIKRNMACHRKASDGSWSVRVLRNPVKKIAHCKEMISFLNDFNSYSNYQNQSAIQKRISDYQKMMKDAKRDKIKNYIKDKYPNIYRAIKRLKTKGRKK